MPDPTTVNRGLFIPVHGADVDSWDSPLNSNFATIDALFGAVLAIATTGGTTTLTATQADNAVIRVSGTLTGSALIRFPQVSAYYIVENLTTGAFILQFSTTAGAGKVIAVEQGTTATIYTDGLDTKYVNLPPVASYLDVADAVVPAWITGCTVPPYLNCNGGTFSAVTYPYLAVKLGGTTLPDLRGVARYTLNQGTSRLTSAGSGLDGNTNLSIKTTQSATLITPNLPPYTPAGNNTGGQVLFSFTTSGNVAGSGSNAGVTGITSGTNFAAQFIPPGFTGTAQGGTSTPFGVIGTGTVAGITLIRAA